MPFGARTRFLPNTDMLTEVNGAGDQLDALGGGFGFENMYDWISRLRADKERQRRSAAQWDQGLAQDQARWEAEQEANRINRERIRANEAAMRSTPQPGINPLFQNLDRLQGMRQDFYGQRIGSNPRFADLLPASAMAGTDLMQGRKTGWDQYVDLAKAGAGQSQQAEAEAGTMRRLRAGGGARR